MTRQLNILYVENHAVFANVVKNTFLSSHVVTVVPSLQAARELLTAQAFDLVLVDYDLDDGKGDAVIRWMGEVGKTIPAIAVSSHEDGNAAMVAAGARASCLKSQCNRIHEVIGLILG